MDNSYFPGWHEGLGPGGIAEVSATKQCDNIDIDIKLEHFNI